MNARRRRVSTDARDAMRPVVPRADLFQARRCKRCRSPVAIGFDIYLCPVCGALPAGLFDPDPTEPDD